MQPKTKPNSNPILDTLETVPGYPETLKIYRVPCSSFYYMRCWLNGKMVPRSTKTRNKELAKKTAGAFYNELLLKRAKGEPLTESNQFHAAYEGLLIEDKARVARGAKLKQSSIDDLEYIYKQDLQPFFHRDQLKDISYTRICEFVAKVEQRGISPKTVKNRLMFLSKILNWAVRHGKLDKVPIFPNIEIKDSPRSWLNKVQYELLIDTIEQSISDRVVIRHHRITRELTYLVGFMVGSYLRTTDIKTLKNKDITIIRHKDNPHLLIYARGKVAESEVVTLDWAVDTYEKLTELNTKLGFGKPDDFVFFPGLTGREHAQKIMAEQFSYVLKKAGLKIAPNGEERVLGCLRHTAIMFALIESNVDELTLAINARTSIEMIQKFYASQLTPQMRVKEIQSRKAEYKAA